MEDFDRQPFKRRLIIAAISYKNKNYPVHEALATMRTKYIHVQVL